MFTQLNLYIYPNKKTQISVLFTYVNMYTYALISQTQIQVSLLCDSAFRTTGHWSLNVFRTLVITAARGALLIISIKYNMYTVCQLIFRNTKNNMNIQF